MQVTVKADFKAVLKALRGLEKQAPFATSLALNNTAEKVRAHVKEHLRDTMTVRNKWTPGGMGGKGGRPLTTAEKSTKKQLSVAVGSVDPYMESQAKGGTRKKGQGAPRGKNGGKALAFPAEGLKRGKSGIVPRSKWPNKLALKPRHYFVTLKSGAVGLFKRRGKHTWRKGKRIKGIPLWIFVRRVRMGLAKKWKLGRQTQAVVEREWARQAGLAIQRALATAH